MRISDWSSDVCSSDLNASPITSVPDPAEHPVVRTHPGNGRLALYVNPWFTERFSGMTAAESRPLLDFLAAEATRPENVYRHRWRQHDVIMWDRSEEHTSELQSLMRSSYAVFCLKKKIHIHTTL